MSLIALGALYHATRHADRYDRGYDDSRPAPLSDEERKAERLQDLKAFAIVLLAVAGIFALSLGAYVAQEAGLVLLSILLWGIVAIAMFAGMATLVIGALVVLLMSL